MLVLTRKSNQSIMIGDEIEITILSVVGEKVRVGISAPGEVPVYRTEIYLSNKGGATEGSSVSAQEIARQVDDALSGLGTAVKGAEPEPV